MNLSVRRPTPDLRISFAADRRPIFAQLAGSSLVRARERDLIAGAARRTTGDIAAHEISHDASQFHRKWPVATDGKLAMPAATREQS